MRQNHREDIPVLRKTLGKLLRYQVSRQNTPEEIVKAKANIYRHLVNFSETLDEALDTLSQEMIDSGVKIDFKFPDYRENLIVVEFDGMKFVAIENY